MSCQPIRSEIQEGEGHLIPKNRLGPLFYSMCTVNELVDAIEHNQTHKKGCTVLALNAHIFNLAVQDDSLMNHLNQADIVVADGMSIVWASKFLGSPLQERCNMTEVFRAYLTCAKTQPATAILVGCTEEEAGIASDVIQKTSPELTILQAISGFLPEEEIYAKIDENSSADIFLIGMGTPKSERLAANLAKKYPESLRWHIGGGTVLFLSGKQVEAPPWMRKSGLQWLHRLIREPRRMWKRYLIGNILFVFRLLKIRFSGNHRLPL